jgi:protein-S-isoprenylcysteine O-methyltransferase Ste14
MEVLMHRQPDPSDLPRLAFAAAHALLLGAVLWLYGGGVSVLGNLLGMSLALGDSGRRVLLTGCAVVLLVRMRLTTGPFMWRPFDWVAARISIAIAAVYQIGFALAGVTTVAPLEGWIDQSGVFLFVLGSGIATGAEFARSRSAQTSQRRSALCTGGLFAVVRHPETLGDLMWGAGWAMLTRSIWALALSVVVTLANGASTAAGIDRYLEEQEGPLFRSWAGRTKRIIPFLY